MKVCIGGTFNVLHKGHKILLDKAFQIAGEKGTVYIGISEGELIKKKKYTIPLDERIKAIKNYLSIKEYNKQTAIVPIHHKFGIAVEEDFDVIIVSPETTEKAEEINKQRIKNGKKPMKIEVVSHVLADDDKPISSTRILNKEIDREGRLLD